MKALRLNLPVKVKICGLKDKATILAAAKADFIGFVFYQKSSRFINAFDAKKLIQYIPAEQKVVGLFVNSDINTLYHINDFLNLDLIQLHGNEDINYIEKVKKLGKPIIKAISVKNFNDIKNSRNYEKICDMILFDTKSNSEVSGGTGNSFDWNLLKGYDSKKNWLLAGGLKASNIIEALKITNAPIVDVSSGIEKARGIKCEKKIKKFLNLVKEYERKN